MFQIENVIATAKDLLTHKSCRVHVNTVRQSQLSSFPSIWKPCGVSWHNHTLIHYTLISSANYKHQLERQVWGLMAVNLTRCPLKIQGPPWVLLK